MYIIFLSSWKIIVHSEQSVSLESSSNCEIIGITLIFMPTKSSAGRKLCLVLSHHVNTFTENYCLLKYFEFS